MAKLVKKKYSFLDYLKFIVPSVIGVLLLMFPFQYKGETTIVVALLATKFTELLGGVQIGRASCRERV